MPGEIEVREGQADYTGRICVIGTDSVSYTHLDVYKRQEWIDSEVIPTEVEQSFYVK